MRAALSFLFVLVLRVELLVYVLLRICGKISDIYSIQWAKASRLGRPGCEINPWQPYCRTVRTNGKFTYPLDQRKHRLLCRIPFTSLSILEKRCLALPLFSSSISDSIFRKRKRNHIKSVTTALPIIRSKIADHRCCPIKVKGNQPD